MPEFKKEERKEKEETGLTMSHRLVQRREFTIEGGKGATIEIYELLGS